MFEICVSDNVDPSSERIRSKEFMARENQDLQIALIVSVMLTIILGVATFLCYRTVYRYGKEP